MTFEQIDLYLEVATGVVVILGFPLAFIQYRITKRKEKRDREYGTYNALDEKYLEFQKFCLQYPDLNIFDIQDSNPRQLTETQRKQELILFTMLFSIFERSYLLYSDQYSHIKKKQWLGWDSYIKTYCRRDNFLEAWKVSGATFDTEFEKYMIETIAEVRAELETEKKTTTEK